MNRSLGKSWPFVSVYQARFDVVIPVCRGCSAEAGAVAGRAICPLPNQSLDCCL
jgi:hypothetical protein